MNDNFDELRDAFQQAMEILKQEDEQFWNDLTHDQQLMAFCAVVRRICQAELVEQRSYRGTLYDVFGFGMESYARAQNAGFLELHNCIYTADYERRLLTEFAKFLKVDNPEQAVKQFRT